MWVSKVGPSNAKRMLLTGDLIQGPEALRMVEKTENNICVQRKERNFDLFVFFYEQGLASAVVAEEELDAEVERWLVKLERVPTNQLMMHKLLINSAITQQGHKEKEKTILFISYDK
jgi:enoyl-CoA hydratase